MAIRGWACVVLALVVVSGCNSQVAPAGGGPAPGNGNVAAAPEVDDDSPAAPVGVAPASDAPAPSGLDFTIWNARKVGNNIELKLRRDNMGSPSEKYRLLVES